MKSPELKLDPARIQAILNQKKHKEQLEYETKLKNRLRIRLNYDKKKFAYNMEMKPNFYRLRPLDIQLQIRHNNLKLLPVANTKPNPEQAIKIYRASLYTANITQGLQQNTCQYRTSINKKFLIVNHIKKLELDKKHYNLRLRPRFC